MLPNRAVTALLLISALVVLAPPARAQYMYLDANGNGVHDPGDQLAPNGTPTAVDLWVVTDHNRDGSLVTCLQDPTAPMTLISYVINLAAGGGAVSYGGFTNYFGSVGFGEINPGDGIRYKNGYGSPYPLPAGTYRVCKLTITGVSGTPHVDIVDLVQGSTESTSLGSNCFGNDFDNTLKLIGPNGGTDWADADGLGAGGIDEGAPSIDPIANKTVNEGSCLTFTATATAAHGGALVFTLDSGAPSGASITPGGQFTWCPTEAQAPGVYSVTIRVTEDGAPTTTDAETFQITAAEVNQKPLLDPISNKTIMAGNTLSFTATASDPDLPANTLFFSLDSAPPGATITAGGLFSWPVPVNQVAGVSITVRVTDSGGLGDTKSFFVTVLIHEEGPPVVNNPGNMTVNEGSCLIFTATAISAGGGTLTFSLGAGAPAGASITAAGQFSWCPTEAQGPGTYSITVNCSDGSQTGSATFAVTVREVNLAPVLNPIGNKAGSLGAPVTFTATATDADLPANSLTFSLDPGAPAGATIDPTTGAFSWTVSSCGSTPVTIRVTDNGSLALSDAETILIETGCGSGVVLNPIGDKTTNEQATLLFSASATTSDGSLASFSLTGTVPLGASITSAGAFMWTPTEAQGPGVYPVTICAQVSGGTDCETISITVLETNMAPVLSPIGNKTVCVGHLLAFTATATDADLPANTLTFSLDQGAPPGATITAGGSFTWTPQEFGVFPATIRVTDNGSPPLSDSEIVAIGVLQFGCTGVPFLEPIVDMTVSEGNIAEQIVIGSDTANNPLTFSGSGPPFMTVTTTSPTTGAIHLAPGFADAGTYTASVNASNGTFTTSSLFHITVVNVCRPPAADAGGPYAGAAGSPVALNGAGSADPDGDALTYAWSFGDGTTGSGVAPTHVYALSGTYTVSLEVSDGCGSDTDVTTVSIFDCLTAYFEGTGNKFVTFDLNSGKPTECILLEPVLRSFAIEEVDLASIVMRSPNSGSIGEIHAVATKNALGGDRNNNFVEEITVCFAKDDLRLLFSNVTSTNPVNVTLEGRLANGASFCANETVNVRAARGGGNLAASISPNPLNPSAVLTFSTQERGPVLVQLFDVHGRLVRTLRHDGDAAAGYHDVRIDGLDANGARLTSGVYFVRVRAGSEEERKTITILK